MQIELTQTQSQTLLQLLDIAVKSAGLNAAQPALEIATIVQTALEKEQS